MVALIAIFFRQTGGGSFVGSLAVKDDFLVFGQGGQLLLKLTLQQSAFQQYILALIVNIGTDQDRFLGQDL